ncbi:MAG: flgL [Pseudomonas sp.]|nr:flgL [Pseudomonas sp.]
MRISTSQFYEASAANYQRIYSNVVSTGQEVSSQVRVNTAGDDPLGASRLLQLSQQSSMLDQYTSNITAAKSQMSQSETAMNAITTALQRAQELVIGGSTGTLSDKDRQANAAELSQIQGQVLSLMNTQDASGNYIFSGSKSSTPPYTQNADGTYAYHGDQTSVSLPIGDKLSVASNTTGWQAFEQAINTTRTSATMTAPPVDDGRVSLSGGLVSNTQAYNASFGAGQPYTVNFISSTQFTVTDAGGTDITSETSQNGKFSSADASSQSISLRGVDFNLNVNLSAADKTSTATADAALAGHSFSLAVSPDTVNASRSPGNTSGSVITSATITNPAAYSAAFPTGGAILKFTSATAFDLYAAPIDSNSKPVSSGTIVGTTATAAGVSFNLSGAPAAGDNFSVSADTHQTQNVLNTLGAAITALNTPADGNPVALQKLRATMESSLGNLSSASAQIGTALSDSGARGNIIDRQNDANTTLGLNNTVDQGKIRDSDPVEAYTRLTLQTTMLSAAQLAFSKISQLGLFNKI